MKKTTLAGLFLAMSVLIGTGAAYADSVVTNYVTGTISSDGAILDSNGNIVGRMDGGVIRRTQVVSMPQSGSSSTVVTRTVQNTWRRCCHQNNLWRRDYVGCVSR
jgi:hypothetical protein